MNPLNQNESFNPLVMLPAFMSVRSDSSDKHPFPISSGPFWFLDAPQVVDEIEIKKVFLEMVYRESTPQPVIEEKVKKKIFHENAQNAGKKPKTDSLGKLIRKIVAQNSDITEKGLYRELVLDYEEDKYEGVIVSINSKKIEFNNVSFTHLLGHRLRENPASLSFTHLLGHRLRENPASVCTPG